MAILTLDIKSELPTAIRWTDTMTKQLPFAISQALNSVGFDGRTALGGASRQYFNQPTKFIENAWLVRKANKRNLEVQIYPERKRLPYLRANIYGGSRGRKPFEVKLVSMQVGNMPSNVRLVPNIVSQNSQGNVSRATLGRIIRNVQSSGKNSVFIGKPLGGGREPGVYQRMASGKLRPLFTAVPQARYERRFPIADIVGKVAERRFGGYLRSSLERAMASAR
jgi:hypothetical protein